MSALSLSAKTTTCSNDHFSFELTEITNTQMNLEYQVDTNLRPDYFNFVQDRLGIAHSSHINSGSITKEDLNVSIYRDGNLSFLVRFFPENQVLLKRDDESIITVGYDHIPVMYIEMNQSEDKISLEISFYKNHKIIEEFNLLDCQIAQ